MRARISTVIKCTMLRRGSFEGDDWPSSSASGDMAYYPTCKVKLPLHDQELRLHCASRTGKTHLTRYACPSRDTIIAPTRPREPFFRSSDELKSFRADPGCRPYGARHPRVLQRFRSGAVAKSADHAQVVLPILSTTVLWE